MARKTEDLAAVLRSEIMNRPEEDDLFAFPESYYEALTRAHKWLRNKVAKSAKGVLSATTTVTTSDDGDTYDLTDDYIGEIEVWEPPGPPTGHRIMPAVPESTYRGFWLEGVGASQKIHLTDAKVFTPGLYVRGVTASASALDEDNEHTLPEYMEDCLLYRAAYLMSMTPARFKAMYLSEWRGDSDDPSDTGIAGQLARMRDNEGIMTGTDLDVQPWWRGIN